MAAPDQAEIFRLLKLAILHSFQPNTSCRVEINPRTRPPLDFVAQCYYFPVVPHLQSFCCACPILPMGDSTGPGICQKTTYFGRLNYYLTNISVKSLKEKNSKYLKNETEAKVLLWEIAWVFIVYLFNMASPIRGP